MNKELTASELAEKTGFSLPHISVMVKRGELPQGRKEGRETFYPVEAVAYLQKRGKRKSPIGTGTRGGRKKAIQLDDLF